MSDSERTEFIMSATGFCAAFARVSVSASLPPAPSGVSAAEAARASGIAVLA